MPTLAYNFGAALAQRLDNPLRQKQAAGGIAGAIARWAKPSAPKFKPVVKPSPIHVVSRGPDVSKPGNLKLVVKQDGQPEIGIKRFATQLDADKKLARGLIIRGEPVPPELSARLTTAGHLTENLDAYSLLPPDMQRPVARTVLPMMGRRKMKFKGAPPDPPRAAPPPAVKPTAAAAPAAPTRTPSIPGRAFSAARAYGNMTGVAPTSRTGLAMFGINPLLQQGAGMLDNFMGTNFSGQDPNQTDWTSRVGQVAFPTSRAQSYLKQNLPTWLQQAQQFLTK